MLDVKVTQVCNSINILLIYNQHLKFIDNNVAVNLELQNIKKY